MDYNVDDLNVDDDVGDDGDVDDDGDDDDRMMIGR